MEENKITIPNETYKQLLLNDYKYNALLMLFEKSCELSGNKLSLKYGIEDKIKSFMELNEGFLCEALIEKLKIEKEKEENE